MTLVTTQQRAVKTISYSPVDSLDIKPPKPFLQAKLHRVSPNSPKDFAELISSLTQYQTLIYGNTELTHLTKDNRRTKQNFANINNPWIGFDGDYTIQGHTLSIAHLQNIDPQLGSAGYVIHNSSSNLIIDGKEVAPHRLKIWMQFNTSSQEDLDKYIDTLKKRAVLQGYAEYLVSPNPSTYSMYLRFIFDHSVFSPERVWYEAPPHITSSHITHNSDTTYREGPPIDITALPTLTDYEESVYNSILQQLKRDKYHQQEQKKKEVKINYPDMYKRYEQAKDYILTDDIITSTGHNIPVHRVIMAQVNDDKEAQQELRNLAFKDPLDPDYGDNKAKLFFNDDSVYLHSFAHGSQSYRLAIPLVRLLDDKNIPERPNRGETLSSSKRVKAVTYINTVSKYYLIQDINFDLNVVAEELKHISTLTTMRKILMSNCLTRQEHIIEVEDPMRSYYLYTAKSTPVIQYDLEDGLQLTNITAVENVMANRIPGMSGAEIVSSFLVNKDRREVSGYGLYQEDKVGKLNLWTGFDAAILKQTVTEEDIQPFLKLTRLFASRGVEESYLYSYLADMIQSPLRKGARSALAIKGDKRTGKSFFMTLIGSLFHKPNRFRTSSADRVLGRFNSHLSSCVCLLCDELNFSNTSISGAKDSIKSLITDEEMPCEMKNIDTTMVPNHIHMILSTNHAQAVLQDSDDVRWTIFEISTEHKDDKKWFAWIDKWWYTGGKNLVYTYLTQYKYDETVPMTGLITYTQRIEKASSFYDLADFVFHMLVNSSGDAEYTIKPNELHEHYLAYIENKVKKPLPPRKFGLELNKLCIFVKSNNERLINIKEDRKVWAELMFGGDFDWDEYKRESFDTKHDINNNTYTLEGIPA